MKVELRIVSDTVHDFGLSKTTLSFENDELAIATYWAAVEYVRRIRDHEPDCPGVPPTLEQRFPVGMKVAIGRVLTAGVAAVVTGPPDEYGRIPTDYGPFEPQFLETAPDRHVVGDEHDEAIVVPPGEPSRSPWAGSPPGGPVTRMEPSPTRGLIEWVHEEADQQTATDRPPGSAPVVVTGAPGDPYAPGADSAGRFDDRGAP